MRGGNRLFGRPGGFSYRHKLMAVIMLAILVPTAVGSLWVSWQYHNQTTREWIREYGAELDIAAGTVGDILLSTMQKSLFLGNNLSVGQFIRADYRDDLPAYLTQLRQMSDLIGAMESDHLGQKILLYVWNESMYSNQFVRNVDELPDDLVERVLASAMNAPVIRLAEGGNGKHDLHVYATIKDLNDVLAVIEIRTGFDVWTQPFRSVLPENGFLALLAEDGSAIPIASGEVDEQTVENAVRRHAGEGDAGRHWSVESTVPVWERPVVLFVDPAPLIGQLRGYLALAGVLAAAVVAVVYFTIRSVTNALTKRLYLLIKNISARSDLGSSGVEAAAAPANYDEFDVIDKRFTDLIERIHDYYRRINDYELEKQQLRTKILQVNINPHFLYNTLSAIKWTFPDERLTSLIDEMVDYYRIFLNKGQSLQSIRLETQMLKSYLDIQKFAYGLEFAYEISVQEGAKDALILKNLLQPIVENAFLHGINGMESGGLIEIRVERLGGRLSIMIRDNGAGMPEELLASLMQGPVQTDAKPFGGYGFYNVRMCLDIYYGSDCDIRVESAPGAGTTVRLDLPALSSRELPE